MFCCSFCDASNENGSWFVQSGLCDTCTKVRDLSKIYSMDSLLKSLESIYVREESPIKKRTDAIAEGVELRSSKKNKIMTI
tara:strand:- start:171 stop:413 length:243 start_codon:yes stop_codon:yes gene_type:complete